MGNRISIVVPWVARSLAINSPSFQTKYGSSYYTEWKSTSQHSVSHHNWLISQQRDPPQLLLLRILLPKSSHSGGTYSVQQQIEGLLTNLWPSIHLIPLLQYLHVVLLSLSVFCQYWFTFIKYTHTLLALPLIHSQSEGITINSTPTSFSSSLLHELHYTSTHDNGRPDTINTNDLGTSSVLISSSELRDTKPSNSITFYSSWGRW